VSLITRASTASRLRQATLVHGEIPSTPIAVLASARQASVLKMASVPTGGVPVWATLGMTLEMTLESVLEPGVVRTISGPASPGADRRKAGARNVLEAAILIDGFQMVLRAIPALNAGHRRAPPAAAAQG
jgi:hypothetical protein